MADLEDQGEDGAQQRATRASAVRQTHHQRQQRVRAHLQAPRPVSGSREHHTFRRAALRARQSSIACMTEQHCVHDRATLRA